jgi:hypothetical protein
VLFCALFTVAHQFPSVINLLSFTYFPNPFFAVLHLIGLTVGLLWMQTHSYKRDHVSDMKLHKNYNCWKCGVVMAVVSAVF